MLQLELCLFCSRVNNKMCPKSYLLSNVLLYCCMSVLPMMHAHMQILNTLGYVMNINVVSSDVSKTTYYA